MAKRITEQVEREEAISITIDNRKVHAYNGETLASILFLNDIRVFYKTRNGTPRAPYCNMGACFECQVEIKYPERKSKTWVRACMTPVQANMIIYTGRTIHGDANDH